MIRNFEIIVFGYREDRWVRCEEILSSYGLKATRIKTNPPAKNLEKYRQTQREFLGCLKQKKARLLTFFEDDFELTDGWEDVLRKAWDDVPKDFDLLYLGANLTDKPERLTNNLVRIRGAWTFHGVMISGAVIEYIFRNYDPNKNLVFDEWLRRISPMRRFFMVYPMICYQREGFSDYAGKVVFHNLFNNKYYKQL
jgi:hypothetical protein